MTGRELIGQCVWDVRGVWVGHVVDVRMVTGSRNPFKKSTEPETAGLVVSATRAQFLLGVHRDASGRVNGALQQLTRLLYARSLIVPWDLVETSDTGEVHLKEPREVLTRQ